MTQKMKMPKHLNPDIWKAALFIENAEDKQEAADTLGRLTKHLLRLLDSIKSDNKDGVKRLIDKFDPNQITENIPGSMYVAYSVNKGDELSICIREKETNTHTQATCILPPNSKDTFR